LCPENCFALLLHPLFLCLFSGDLLNPLFVGSSVAPFFFSTGISPHPPLPLRLKCFSPRRPRSPLSFPPVPFPSQRPFAATFLLHNGPFRTVLSSLLLPFGNGARYPPSGDRPRPKHSGTPLSFLAPTSYHFLASRPSSSQFSYQPI